MQPAHQAAASALRTASSSKSPTAEKASSSSPVRASQSVIDHFWVRMSHMFGHSWVSQYGDNPAGPAGDTWGAVLAGLSNAQIAHGLRATMALGSDWPPSAPRFRSMCFAIPSLAQASHAFRTKSTDAFTRQMWTYIDSYGYRHADSDKGGRMIRDAYELACKFVMEGGQLPDEAVAFIDPGKSKPLDDASPDVIRRAGEARSKSMADIAQIFGSEV